MSQPSPTIRKRRNAAPASLTSVVKLDAFLATAPARRCTRVFVIRTSNESRVQFEAMFKAGVSLLPDDPDVRVLAEQGPSIVMPQGAQQREALGAMELRRGSVPGGWGTKLLGWLIPIGRTLFVLYLDTARTADLAGATRDQAKNAFTEAICEIVRSIKPQQMYAPILNRLVRNVDFGQQVLRTLREYGVDVWVGGKQLELAGKDHQLRAILETYFAAKDADDTVERLTGIEANMYANGDWYVTTRFLPFTWRPRVRIGIHPITKEAETTVPDPRDIEVTPGSLAQFDALVELLIDRGKSLREIGIEMGRRGLRSRAPKHFNDPVQLDQLAQPQHAITTLIQQRWLDAWLDGTYRTSVRLKADLRDSHPALRDHIGERETEDGRTELWLDVELSLPMPDRGYWLTTAQYDAIMEARHAPTPQRIGRAASNGDRRPLSSLSQWDDHEAGRQYRLATFDSSATYSCLWRPLADAYAVEHEGGVPFALGWSKQHHANKLASVAAVDLHASIGNELIRLAAELEGQTASIVVPSRALPPIETVQAHADVERAESALARIDNRLAGIRKDRQEARGRGDDEEVAQLDEDRARASAEREEALEDLAKAHARAAQAMESTAPPPASVEADLGSLELVGVALVRCGAFAPAALNDALAQLLGSSLRVHPLPSALGVTWDAVVRVPLADGGVGTHAISSPEPVRGIAFTVRRDDGTSAGPDWRERLVEEFMDKGLELAEVCRLRGVDDSGRADTYPVKQIRAWLADHGVVNGKRRQAILDAPAEVRRALAPLLRGQEPSNAYERRLLAAYTVDSSWGVCWAAETHDIARQVALVIEQLGGGEVDPLLVAQRASIPWKALVELTSVRQISRARSGIVTVGPLLHRNWNKGNGDPERRRIRLQQCPHPDCHGVLRGAGPGTLIQLVVPELGDSGLICPDCRRQPDDADAVYPELYLKPWRGGRRKATRKEGRVVMVGTHLEAKAEVLMADAA